MKPREFHRSIDLPADAETVFHWHSRPGAFQRLAPPWDRVDMVGAPAAVEVGARQKMTVPIGPLRLRWSAEITAVDPGRGFQDVQLAGPFSSWEHTHTMRDTELGHSVLDDRVRYAPPLGRLGELVGGWFIRKQLDRLFAYRHRITMQDLQRHEGAAAPMDILVAGSSGLVGTALTSFLTTGGHRVRRLVRRKPGSGDEFRWDPVTGEMDADAFKGVDAVVHLAGENIAGRRWSAVQKDRIRRSRVESTRQLVHAIGAQRVKPKVFVSASAVGIYGDRGDEVLDEDSSAGTGFLAGVCKDWEREAQRLAVVRTVQLRFGVILSPAGGALAKMLLPFKLGAGGRIGSGEQWMSWIALDDVVGAIHHALVTESLRGPVNTVAPGPVTNADYTRTLGKVLGRPTILPMPAFAARLAFGELADELLLASQRVAPKALQESGYAFSYPGLEGALRHQLGRGA